MALSISGLSGSGIDTVSIVKSLMDVERIPFTTLESKKSLLQSEQAVFRQVNTKLNVLDTALTELKFLSSTPSYKGTSSSDKVTINSTSSSASSGTYDLAVTTAAKEATASVSGSELANALKKGNIKIGNIDFSDQSLRSRLGIVDDGNDATNANVLRNAINYINSNSSQSQSTVSMLNNGANQIVNFKSLTSDAVGITDSSNVSLSPDKVTHTAGSDAVFSLNGQSFTRNSNTVNDIIPGVSFTIGSDATGTTAKLKVENDNSKVKEKIQNFVNTYNDVASLVRTNLAKPTDEDSINPLQGDSTLKDINSRLYTLFNSKTADGFMEDIGLSIDKGVTRGSGMTGQIKFDTEKFDVAMADNPEKAFGIIESVSKNMQSTVFRSWTSHTSGILATAISGYDAELKATDTRMEAMDRSLQLKEARFKSQFAAMETMINSLNSTNSWLTQQFNSLSKKD